MKFKRYLTQDDATVLSRLAEQLMRVRDVRFNSGETLIDIISTSILLPENTRKKNFVSLYAEVAYTGIEHDGEHAMTIVCPQDANQALAHVSILAPLALALIGREVDSMVEVELPFSQVHVVKILGVRNASATSIAPALRHG
ncbi:transcriptional regulator [Noviherbaspirillum cavernae]|uniref:Transcriptional regulator n=1 Tax=Noviherbaspirillum cavernae TaxID=2320862 RepID=A0A418X2L5_9BURK|nr:GreA/GreB family elongation factor [Noviherbaspirillum cavernae]RJG06699.1 transcriptional regulator [Noviherbaspirillum cavernae]